MGYSCTWHAAQRHCCVIDWIWSYQFFSLQISTYFSFHISLRFNSPGSSRGPSKTTVYWLPFIFQASLCISFFRRCFRSFHTHIHGGWHNSWISWIWKMDGKISYQVSFGMPMFKVYSFLNCTPMDKFSSSNNTVLILIFWNTHACEAIVFALQHGSVISETKHRHNSELTLKCISYPVFANWMAMVEKH